jgi:hypothetical protein
VEISAALPWPWSVEDIGMVFKVCGRTGQRLAYVYFEDEPGRRSTAPTGLLFSPARPILLRLSLYRWCLRVFDLHPMRGTARADSGAGITKIAGQLENPQTAVPIASTPSTSKSKIGVAIVIMVRSPRADLDQKLCGPGPVLFP